MLCAKWRPFCLGLNVFRKYQSWWRHQIETFSALLAICAENLLVIGEFPAQRPVTRRFEDFFDLRLNKQLSKQWWGCWFETQSCPLWRHCNGMMPFQMRPISRFVIILVACAVGIVLKSGIHLIHVRLQQTIVSFPGTASHLVKLRLTQRYFHHTC